VAGLTDLCGRFSEHVRIAFFPVRRVAGDTGKLSLAIERQFLRNLHGWLHADGVLIGAHPLGMAPRTKLRDGLYEQSAGNGFCHAMASVTYRAVLFYVRDVTGNRMLIPHNHSDDTTEAERVFHDTISIG
jgi:hypothetical protein